MFIWVWGERKIPEIDIGESKNGICQAERNWHETTKEDNIEALVAALNNSTNGAQILHGSHALIGILVEHIAADEEAHGHANGRVEDNDAEAGEERVDVGAYEYAYCVAP